MKRIIVVLVAAVFLTMNGCASKLHESGSKFEFDNKFNVAIGHTKKNEIITKYGPPTTSKIVGEYEILNYNYQLTTGRSASGAKGSLFFVAAATSLLLDAVDSDNINTEMVFIVDAVTGLLQDYYYHDYNKLVGHDDSETAYLVALKFSQQKKLQDAIAKYKESITLNKNNHRSLNNLAWLLIDNDFNVDEGIEYARRAVEIFPKSPYYTGTLGTGYFKKQDYDNAIKYLQKAVELYPVYAPENQRGYSGDLSRLNIAKSKKNNVTNQPMESIKKGNAHE